MAVYMNLGIDCGESETVANSLMRGFEDFSIHIKGVALVTTSTHKEFQRGLWFVGIQPIGMGYAIPSGTRPELVEDANSKCIETALLDHLKSLNGYRRAMFGGEAFDTLCYGDKEEHDDIDYIGMIFSNSLFSNITQPIHTLPFSQGYSIVISDE